MTNDLINSSSCFGARRKMSFNSTNDKTKKFDIKNKTTLKLGYDMPYGALTC